MTVFRAPVCTGDHRRNMQYDFIVIGAGIAGASISYELARTNRVCLIEGESRPGFHATGRSAALFAPSYGGREIRAATRASRAFFERPPPGFAEHPLLLPRGCLYIARDDQLRALAEMVGEVRASGGNIATVTLAAARKLVPLLKPGYVAEAALDLDAMDIEVDALHQGFLRGARAAGATLVTGHWARCVERLNGAWSIDLGSETVHAPVLVNAAGAWADEVAETCGARRLGVQPFRRTAVLVDVPDGIDARRWPAVIDADEQFYFKPDAGKLLISPADETPDAPGDAQPDDLDVAIGIDRVQKAIDLEVRQARHRWAGLRTFAPDRVPVVGFDAHVPGFFWYAGQGGYGIQTAPALSRTAAALARQDGVPRDVAAEGLAADDVSPRRFERAIGSERRA
jgi:D-arginine dehydrogenase